LDGIVAVEIFTYHDTLEQLNRNVPLAAKVRSVHDVLKCHFPCVARIAAALYDPRSDLVKTFVESSGTDQPLLIYQARLEEAPSLRQILHTGLPRVVNDLNLFRHGTHRHTQLIARLGYTASYTMPMYYNGVFFGFLFFNSHEPDVFEPQALHTLDVFGHLISLVIIDELAKLRMLSGAIKAARTFTVQRDRETGAHVDRMAHYVRLIARDLAPRHDFDDAYVERLFLFAPLHDIGKIGIPDCILQKAGKLTPDEFEVMKTHTTRGRQLVDELIADFGLDDLDGVDTLRNIAEFHHEALNGTGYPRGLKGGEIPLEARIIAVADVFDALTSRRPYKQAFSNDEAFAMLEQLSGTRLDPECIRALASHRETIREIQRTFAENPYG
jgi:HD-GYP domain-containing protein (c-di-GMP phosphodiesterase class II)